MNAPLSTQPVAVDQPRRISAWSLIRPYWVSEDRWAARGLLLLVLAINLAIVYVNVRLNQWNVRFYNALQDKNSAAFLGSLKEFSVLAFIFIGLAVGAIYYRQMLEFRWRQWLTHRYVGRWLGNAAFYRIERDRLADNPDQRISDDLQSLATTTLALTLDLVSTLVTLVTFIFILWSVSGALAFTLAGQHISIPGYMVWVALIYALIGSYVVYKVARPMVTVNYQQQRVEANFRFALIRLRESSEEIALYNGADTESGRLRGVFDTIRANWIQVMRFTKRLTLVNSVYGQIAIIFPIFAAAPQYFSGVFALGVLMQINSAFGRVSDSMSWFINSFSTLASWRATINRLREFQRVLDTQHFAEAESPATLHGGINRHMVDTPALTTRDLKLALPNGQPLMTVGSIDITPGSRWLVHGASGSGKSTLLRSLAGLWPFGDGTIDAPVDAKLMFVPQRPYMPIDTLKAALCYPSGPDTFADDACRNVLIACQLGDYVERLAEHAHWANRMSPGEQQRFAFARVLLQRPDFLFLDEASAALDLPTERALYEKITAALPNTAIVSIAHRDTLAAFHERTLELRDGAVQVMGAIGTSEPSPPSNPLV